MRLSSLQSDGTILAEIGKRIASRRIDRQLTQAQLAERAGVGKRTVERLENGESTQMSTVIRIFRVLELLPNLDTMIPEPGLRPMDLLKLKGKARQRASAPRETDEPARWEWKDKA
jgi:transcriptional regulator with XRE-family HTH domain